MAFGSVLKIPSRMKIVILRKDAGQRMDAPYRTRVLSVQSALAGIMVLVFPTWIPVLSLVNALTTGMEKLAVNSMHATSDRTLAPMMVTALMSVDQQFASVQLDSLENTVKVRFVNQTLADLGPGARLFGIRMTSLYCHSQTRLVWP